VVTEVQLHPRRFDKAVLNRASEKMSYRSQMNQMFDIFTTLPNGRPLWVECIEGVEEARKRMKSLATNRPGDYFIYCEKSGGVIDRIPREPISSDAYQEF
jgi:hypothetical protein